MQLVLQLLREQLVLPPWIMRAMYLVQHFCDLVCVGAVQHGVRSGRKQLEVRSQQLRHLPGSVTVTSIQRQQRALLQNARGLPAVSAHLECLPRLVPAAPCP